MYEEEVEVCDTALDMLGKNGVLLDFDEILLMMIEGLEHTGNQPKKLQKMKKWEMTLSELYEEYGVLLPEGSMGLLTENS